MNVNDEDGGVMQHFDTCPCMFELFYIPGNGAMGSRWFQFWLIGWIEHFESLIN